jgi:hypothetical protein
MHSFRLELVVPWENIDSKSKFFCPEYIYIYILLLKYIYNYICSSLIFVVARRENILLGSVCGPVSRYCVFCFYKSLGLL